MECRLGALHVNTDWYLFEPVDHLHRPATPGEVSDTVLVTNPANRVQPIIRYDLGDRVTVAATACPCGSPFPHIAVEGRTDDVLTCDAVAGGEVEILPLALGTVIEETPGVHRFQAIQMARQTLTLRLEPENGEDPAQLRADVDARLHEFLTAQKAASVSLRHVDQRPYPDPRSGKFRQVYTA